MFEIESNIPIPDPECGVKSKYPFADMKIGDSFLMPYADKTPVKQRMVLIHAIRHFRRKHPDRTFATRQQDTGIRVWRTE